MQGLFLYRTIGKSLLSFTKMDPNVLNQQLHNLYTDYLEHLYTQTWDKGVSAPLLMHVFGDYTQMPCKIMFVGRETHGWQEMNSRLTVSKLQDHYQNFELGKKADYGDGKKPRYLRSPFWNFNRSVFYRLNNSEFGVSRKTNGFLWTNISKFDYASSTPSQELQDKNIAGFKLLRGEIELTKPDIVIFETGGSCDQRSYDQRIEAALGVNVPKFGAELPLVRLDNVSGLSPQFIFKTEHPRTLCQHNKYRGQRMYHKVIEKIVDTVNRQAS